MHDCKWPDLAPCPNAIVATFTVNDECRTSDGLTPDATGFWTCTICGYQDAPILIYPVLHGWKCPQPHAESAT